MKEMTVKEQIINEFVKNMVLDTAQDIIDSNGDADDLTIDEKEDLLDDVMDKFCEEDCLARIDRDALFSGRVCAFVREAVDKIIENRVRIYEVPIAVHYSATIHVKAHSEEEAKQYVKNMNDYDIADNVDSDDIDSWEVDGYLSDEGTEEDYGSDDYYDAT